jgi:hypothetical protein
MSCRGLLARVCARFVIASPAHACVRFGWLGLRGALAGLALSPAAGCDQTDLVASYRGPSCTAQDGCEPGASCSPRTCAALASQRALCAAEAVPVQAGDSCDAAGSAQVARYGLCSCTDLVAPAALRVDAFDATASRPVARAAALGINGSLHADQGGSVDGSLRTAGPVSGGALDVTGEQFASATPPCACADAQLLDLAALARAARDANDNAGLGLDPDALAGLDADAERTLPCGRYYLTGLSGSSALTIRARGNVALFVDGNVEIDQALTLRAEPGARLSVFVAGAMRVGGAFSLGGDPSGSERTALFVGGRGTLQLDGSASLVGTLYAPRAELVSRGNLEVWGSLFVRRAALEGDLVLHQDVSLAEPGVCEAP